MLSYVRINGAVVANPVVPGEASASLRDVFPLQAQAAYAHVKSAAPPLNHVSSAPFAIPLEGIAKVRVLAAVGEGPGMGVKITWAGGTEQVLPASGVVLIHAPAVGDEITAISAFGQGTFRYLIAGDAA